MSKMTTILRLPSSPSNANSLLSRLYQSTPALLLPVIGLLMFLAIWNGVAKSIDTSLGQFPGPAQVFEQAGALIDEHIAQREKADAFYQRQEARNAARVAEEHIKIRHVALVTFLVFESARHAVSQYVFICTYVVTFSKNLYRFRTVRIVVFIQPHCRSN